MWTNRRLRKKQFRDLEGQASSFTCQNREVYNLQYTGNSLYVIYHN
jgi:hypothetical protein